MPFHEPAMFQHPLTVNSDPFVSAATGHALGERVAELRAVFTDETATRWERELATALSAFSSERVVRATLRAETGATESVGLHVERGGTPLADERYHKIIIPQKQAIAIAYSKAGKSRKAKK